MRTPPPGQALFRLVRRWSRAWTGVGEAVDAERGRDVMVAEAVHARGPTGASVNDIAAELGIDQSGASRFAAKAVERGYLRKVASASDARKRELAVTPRGEALLDASHRWQEETFAQLTRGWSEPDVRALHTYLVALLEGRPPR